MRISDWSSDVCSSDLTGELRGIEALFLQPRLQHTSLAPAADESDVGRVGGECSAQCIGIALALRCHHDEALAGRLARKRQALDAPDRVGRSEEHTSELQSLMRISYAVFCVNINTCQYYLCSRPSIF